MRGYEAEKLRGFFELRQPPTKEEVLMEHFPEAQIVEINGKRYLKGAKGFVHMDNVSSTCQVSHILRGIKSGTECDSCSNPYHDVYYEYADIEIHKDLS